METTHPTKITNHDASSLQPDPDTPRAKWTDANPSTNRHYQAPPGNCHGQCGEYLAPGEGAVLYLVDGLKRKVLLILEGCPPEAENLLDTAIALELAVWRERESRFPGVV